MVSNAGFSRVTQSHATRRICDRPTGARRPTILDSRAVPPGVEGQVHRGVGQVLGENAVYDSNTGQLLAGSFMDCPMPHADLMRAIRCDEHPVPTKANALGATMNAILDAVRPAGITDLDMAVTPDRLWRALREARKGSA